MTDSKKILEESLKMAYKEGRVRDHNRFVYWLQKLYGVERDEIDFLLAETIIRR